MLFYIGGTTSCGWPGHWSKLIAEIDTSTDNKSTVFFEDSRLFRLCWDGGPTHSARHEPRTIARSATPWNAKINWVFKLDWNFCSKRLLLLFNATQEGPRWNGSRNIRWTSWLSFYSNRRKQSWPSYLKYRRKNCAPSSTMINYVSNHPWKFGW